MTWEAPKLSPAFAESANSNTEIAPARGRRPSPFSLRLSETERARIERDAAGMPIGGYIRSRLFGEEAAPRRRGKFPVKDHKLLAQALGKLGASRLANNLYQIANAPIWGRSQ